MNKLPPFLPGLSTKLQGRQRRRQLEILRQKRDEALASSLSEFGALFHNILPADRLEFIFHQFISYEKIKTITIAVIIIMVSDGVSLRAFSLSILGVCALAFAGFIWHSLQPSLPSLIVVVSGISLQGLFILSVFLYAWFFRMDRLW